jgi:hypothetical protein
MSTESRPLRQLPKTIVLPLEILAINAVYIVRKISLHWNLSSSFQKTTT